MGCEIESHPGMGWYLLKSCLRCKRSWNLFKIKNNTLFPGGIQSHDRSIAPVSSVADGDETTRPRRRGESWNFLLLILKIFLPKNFAKKMAFLTQNKAKL
jgi:hypothetical protein